MASAAAGAGAGGDLQGLEWAEQTGAATFAVPRDHTDLMRHLQEVLLRGAPEGAIPAQPVRKRRERTSVQSAAGGTEEDPPEASEQDSSGAGEGGRHTRP